MSYQPAMRAGGLLAGRGPLVMAVRHKARINIQRPKLPHWDKARFQKLTQPQLPSFGEMLQEQRGCYLGIETKEKKEVNPLEVLIGKQVCEACDNSQLIAFFHRNSITMSDVHKAWQTLKRAGFTYHKLFNNTIARHAFTGTPLEPVLQLCESHTSLVTCAEPRVAQLLQLQKKLPQLVLLAGVVEGRFLSAASLEEYARLPPLDALRAELCRLLAGPAAGVAAALGHHQTALVGSLTAYCGQAPAEETEVAETDVNS